MTFKQRGMSQEGTEGCHLKKVGYREAGQLVDAFAAGLWEEGSYKRADCDGDGKDADQDEVGCEHRVDQVLGQEFEQQEESQQHSAANEGEGHGILQFKNRIIMLCKGLCIAFLVVILLRVER